MPAAVPLSPPVPAEAQVIRAAAVLDIATAPALLAAVSALAAGGCRAVVVDLGGCEFLDAAGIGALAEGRRRLAAAGGMLAACRPRSGAGRVLAATGMTGALGVHPTLEGALGAVSALSAPGEG